MYGWPSSISSTGVQFVSSRAVSYTHLALLNEESSLMEIVKLIGADILPDDQKLIIETAKVIREGFLQPVSYTHLRRAHRPAAAGG